ncbi:MAG TPA: phosphatidylserine/phosphatidylglycerophosphate/cardiolipin synthase family protein [Rhabdochlamydiaceae bacterium]|nr:phosphatidylserine/phosphatidylglycerophosphate/cardiolipin synthase family protein [Rhabdochlamydiaceae bacterium]
MGIGGGLFWLHFIALEIKLPSITHPIIFYSNQKRDDLKLIICEALKKAKSSILIHIYGLTDPDIIAILKEKKLQGLEITIFYDEKASPNLKSEFQEKLEVFPIHSSGLMHRKILVIDNQLTYLGTANFTPESLRIHDNLIIGIMHATLASHLKCCPTLDFSFQLNDQSVELYFLPDFEKKALDRLVHLIDTAKESISIAMFTLTHPLLTQKLIEAHKRGVEVKIAVDFFTGHGSSCKTLEELQNEGIKIYLSQGDALLHHKWALVDGNTLAMGSANWTAAAFKNNQDCLLVLFNLNKAQKKFLADLWNIIESDCISN